MRYGFRHWLCEALALAAVLAIILAVVWCISPWMGWPR